MPKERSTKPSLVFPFQFPLEIAHAQKGGIYSNNIVTNVDERYYFKFGVNLQREKQ
jgi:hypothetical protein